MKTIAGSILVGLSLLAEVANEWLHHFFFAVFNIAKGTMLEGGGSFSAPPFYAHPETVQIFIGTRIIIWTFMVLGVVMIIWGLLETKTNRR